MHVGKGIHLWEVKKCFRESGGFASARLACLSIKVPSCHAKNPDVFLQGGHKNQL